MAPRTILDTDIFSELMGGKNTPSHRHELPAHAASVIAAMPRRRVTNAIAWHGDADGAIEGLRSRRPRSRRGSAACAETRG